MLHTVCHWYRMKGRDLWMKTRIEWVLFSQCVVSVCTCVCSVGETSTWTASWPCGEIDDMKTLLCVLLLFYLRSNQWTKHRHSCIQNYIIHSWFVVQTRVCICGIIAHVMCDVILIKGVVRRSSASVRVCGTRRVCAFFLPLFCYTVANIYKIGHSF